MNNTPCRKPDGPYLIESAPRFQQYRAAKTAREILQRIVSPLTVCAAAVSGYRSELHHMLDAKAYIGPGR